MNSCTSTYFTAKFTINDFFGIYAYHKINLTLLFMHFVESPIMLRTQYWDFTFIQLEQKC